MHEFTITVRNYKCFTDTKPLMLTVKEGVTALLGPNNSGKSSVLRFIHDSKHFWEAILRDNDQRLFHKIVKSQQSNDYPLLSSPDVATCDITNLPLIVEIVFPETNSAYHIKSLKIISQDTSLFNLKFQVKYNARISGAQIEVDSIGTIRCSDKRIDIDNFMWMAQLLAKAIYVPANRSALSLGQGNSHGIPFGKTIIERWNNLATSNDKRGPQKAINIENELAYLFGFDKLHIVIANDGDFTFYINNKSYRAHDVGTGFLQYLIIFLAVLDNSASCIMVDEPEMNLHPSAQLKYISILQQNTSCLVLLFSTHSMGLALRSADDIYTLLPTSSGTIMQHYNRTDSYAECISTMSYGVGIDRSTNIILLVEGVTEVKAIDELLKIMGHKRGIAVLPLNGTAFIDRGRDSELSQFAKLCDHIYVMIDSEIDSAEQSLAVNRREFLNDCEKLGYKSLCLEKRALENYFSTRAIQMVYGDKYSALSTFQKLGDAKFSWPKSMNHVIASKMTKEELESTDVGGFLKSIMEKHNELDAATVNATST